MRLVGGDATIRAEVAVRLRRAERDLDSTPVVVVLLVHHGGDGLAPVRAATRAGRPVLVLTDQPSGVEAALAIMAGALGYLPLTATRDELRQALASARAGSLDWTPLVAAAVLVGLRGHRLGDQLGDERAAQLRALLRLVGRGWPTTRAARALGLGGQRADRLLHAAHLRVATTSTRASKALRVGP